MSMEELKQSFHQEALEHLTAAEEHLQALADGTSDDDGVNAVFRAVHSIKGGAGAFGMGRAKDFAHVFETTLDHLRQGKISMTVDLGSLLLRSLDMLSDLMREQREGVVIEAGAENALLDDLRVAAGLAAPASGDDDDMGFTPLTVGAMDDDDDMGFTPLTLDGMEASPAAAGGQGGLVVSVIPSRRALATGNEVLLLISEMKNLGGEVSVSCDTTDVPTVDIFDPEDSYLRFSIRVHGLTRAAVEDVFSFFPAEDVSIDEDGEPGPQGGPGGGVDDFPEIGASDPFGGIDPFGDEPASKREPAGAVASAPADDGLSAVMDAAPETTDHQTETRAAVPAAVIDMPRKPAATPPAPSAAQPAAAPRQTLRVDLDKVDRLVNLVGEVVINQAMIRDRVSGLPSDQYADLFAALEDLSNHTRELQESVMAIRAQKIKAVFQKIPRIIRETATATGKKVRLEMDGENTEIDNTVVEQLSDPLTHMIRNAVDHGIETPEARLAAGKPEEGVVRVKAEQRGGRIVISIIDDGKGLDSDRILRKAIEKGVVPEGTSLSEDEIFQLIFAPGFSTADKVTEVSGRGVGMDVVRRNIQNLGGRIGITSRLGKGSTFTMSLPLTLAVTDGMILQVGNQTYVLPLSGVIETLRPQPGSVQALTGETGLLKVRDEYIPIVRVGRLFGISGAKDNPADGIVILIETESGRKTGLLVDELVGRHQAVIKSLETNYQKIPGIAAATILGDGSVALILDAGELFELAGASKMAA